MTQKNNNLASSLPAFRPDLQCGAATRQRLSKSKKVTLLDALDRVIDKGAYVDGEILLRIADIDLVFIGLRLMITSVSNAERLRGNGRMGQPARPLAEDLACARKLEKQLQDIEGNISKIIDVGDSEKTEQGIAKLVLILVKLISQLLEREAVRRVDSGVLSKVEIQKLGLTFKILEKKIQEMKILFGIKEELNLDLGPLGQLI